MHFNLHYEYPEEIVHIFSLSFEAAEYSFLSFIMIV